MSAMYRDNILHVDISDNGKQTSRETFFSEHCNGTAFRCEVNHKTRNDYLVVEADVLNIAGQNTKAHKWIQY
jgi:hypothetical protein